MRHVRRGAAHVEADHPLVAREPGHPHHADDAAGRAGQDRVLAPEVPGLGEPAVGLHEHQPDTGQFVRHLPDVAAQTGVEVGVDHGGVPARHQLHQRARLAGQRHLVEAEPLGEPPDLALVGGVQTAVQADHGDGADAVAQAVAQVLGEPVEVGRAQHLAVGGDPLVHLDHPGVQRLGQRDLAGEDLRPVLVADPQRVRETAGDAQDGRLAGALQQGVGGHRRAHPDRFDVRFEIRAGRQQGPDPRQRGIAVAGRVVREELVGQQPVVRRQRDHVGEGPAPVHPELPAPGCHDRLPPPCRVELCAWVDLRTRFRTSIRPGEPIGQTDHTGAVG